MENLIDKVPSDIRAEFEKAYETISKLKGFEKTTAKEKMLLAYITAYNNALTWSIENNANHL